MSKLNEVTGAKKTILDLNAMEPVSANAHPIFTATCPIYS